MSILSRSCNAHRLINNFVYIAALNAVIFTLAASQSLAIGSRTYLTGNPRDVTPETRPGLALIGGGDGYDDAMAWFVARAGHGDIVVIRTTDSNYYNGYIYPMGADSVETLVVNNRAMAADLYVLERIRQAEGLFIAGGDQSTYVNNWKNTPLEFEVNQLIQRGGVIGGTSAGLAVLGEFVYSAQFGSLATTDALVNPYHIDLTLDHDFFAMPFLKNLITDSHFAARDRMGRLVAFLSRLSVDGWAESADGMGIEEGAAMVIDEYGIGTVMGAGGSAYFLRMTEAPESCMAGQPFTTRHVQVQRISKGSKFDFNTRQSITSLNYELNVVNGVLTSSRIEMY